MICKNLYLQIKLSYNIKTLLLNGDVLDKTYFDKELFDLIITSHLIMLISKYSLKDDLTYEEYLNFSEK